MTFTLEDLARCPLEVCLRRENGLNFGRDDPEVSRRCYYGRDRCARISLCSGQSIGIPRSSRSSNTPARLPPVDDGFDDVRREKGRAYA